MAFDFAAIAIRSSKAWWISFGVSSHSFAFPSSPQEAMNWLSRETEESKNRARNIHASGPCWQTGQEAETTAFALATVSRVSADIDAICSPTFAHFATSASA